MTSQFKKIGSELKGWDIAPPYIQSIEIESIKLHGVGLMAKHPQWGDVIGAAGSLGAPPMDRAWFELVERASIIESIAEGATHQFPLFKDQLNQIGKLAGSDCFSPLVYNIDDTKSYMPARSNGVALYSNWQEACYRASMELIERHHILSSWLGKSRPERVLYQANPDIVNLESYYIGKAYKIGEGLIQPLKSAAHTTMVVYLPKQEYRDKYPLFYGFSCASTLSESIKKAESEAMQRLIFLWGEDLPQTSPDLTSTPHFHQDYYLYPENHQGLIDWLEGCYANHKRASVSQVFSLKYADITSSASGNLRVARALSKDVIEMFFGIREDGPWQSLTGHQKVHPIA